MLMYHVNKRRIVQQKRMAETNLYHDINQLMQEQQKQSFFETISPTNERNRQVYRSFDNNSNQITRKRKQVVDSPKLLESNHKMLEEVFNSTKFNAINNGWRKTFNPRKMNRRHKNVSLLQSMDVADL